MSYIEDSLSDGEEIVEIFQFHWVMWLWFWILLLFFPLVIPLFFAISIFIKLKSTEHGLTNKRVVFKKGFIKRDTDEMRLTSIETVEIDQTVMGRILGYGDISVTGQGLSDVIFRNIDDPLEVKKRIESVSSPPYD